MRGMLETMDVFAIFRFLSKALIAVMLLSGLGILAYLIEPKEELGHQALPVLETGWERTGTNSGSNQHTIRARAILPNGKDAWLRTQPQFVSERAEVCAHVRIGRWSGAFHVDVVDPSLCDEARRPT